MQMRKNNSGIRCLLTDGLDLTPKDLHVDLALQVRAGQVAAWIKKDWT